MSKFSLLCFFSLIGFLGARIPDIDINRIKLQPKESPKYSPFYYSANFGEKNYKLRTNDYDDLSVGLYWDQAPERKLYSVKPTTDKKTFTSHQPREDPRLFYQSDDYIKEINQEHVNKEVSSIFPGREVVQATKMNLKTQSVDTKQVTRAPILSKESNICVRCPRDRTFVAKAGSDRIKLPSPRLTSCSGHKISRNISFVHMYGPQFGSLLEKGSHTLVGRITYKNKTLQTCKMQIQVVVQTCPIPKYLNSSCENSKKNCTFTCRDNRLKLEGQSIAQCGNDFKWNTELPTCKAHRNWCEHPLPPSHAQISCKGNTTENGNGFIDGSKCRVYCARGWRPKKHATTVCRRGGWTRTLVCQKKRRNN